MGKGMRKARACVDLQQQLGQINAWEPGEDLFSQGAQAGRLLELIESGQRERITIVHLFDPDGRIGGEVGRGTLIGGVELVRQGVEFRLRRFAPAQGPTDLGPQSLPLRALQQFDAWITPAFTMLDKHVASSQTVLQTFHHTESIGAPIGDRLAPWEDQPAPGSGDKVKRGLVHIRVALVFELREKGHCREHGLSGLRAVKRDRA